MSGRGVSLCIAASAPASRGGLIDVVPGAQDGDGRLRATLPELGDQVGPFAVGERQVEHHHVERPAVPDQGSPFLQCAGQGNLRAVHLPENELRACAKAEWSSTIITRSIATPPRRPLPESSEHNPNGEQGGTHIVQMS